MDRAVNWGFGLSALGWAAAGVLEGHARSPVGMTIIVINAVVGLRYDASEVVSKGSATEVLCYGTAVVIEPEHSSGPNAVDATLASGNT